MGGVVLRPLNLDANLLQDGHKYVLKFDIKGKTSQAEGTYTERWSNNAGWEGGGLNPKPTNAKYLTIPENWQSNVWIPYSYYWELNDGVYKTCTSAYSSYVKGNTYASYRDFLFGFDYGNTGSMGTDIYLKNFRMYDITNLIGNHSIKQNGIINIDNIVEEFDKASITFDNELWSNEIYEI